MRNLPSSRRSSAIFAADVRRCEAARNADRQGGHVARDATVESGGERLSVQRRSPSERKRDRHDQALGGCEDAGGRSGEAASDAALYSWMATRPARSRGFDERTIR